MEKKKIIVAVVWGNPANECIHAYFFTEKNGRKQGWCAEMAMQEPKLCTAIFKMDKTLRKLGNLEAFIPYRDAKSQSEQMQLVLDDIKTFTKQDIVCVAMPLDVDFYEKVEFTPEGIATTSCGKRMMEEEPLPVDKFIEKYGSYLR